jgi:hypothetical protein
VSSPLRGPQGHWVDSRADRTSLTRSQTLQPISPLFFNFFTRPAHRPSFPKPPPSALTLPARSYNSSHLLLLLHQAGTPFSPTHITTWRALNAHPVCRAHSLVPWKLFGSQKRSSGGGSNVGTGVVNRHVGQTYIMTLKASMTKPEFPKP